MVTASPLGMVRGSSASTVNAEDCSTRMPSTLRAALPMLEMVSWRTASSLKATRSNTSRPGSTTMSGRALSRSDFSKPWSMPHPTLGSARNRAAAKALRGRRTAEAAAETAAEIAVKEIIQPPGFWSTPTSSLAEDSTARHRSGWECAGRDGLFSRAETRARRSPPADRLFRPPCRVVD